MMALYRTLTVPLMEQLIDTLNGIMPSLAESADSVFVMDVMGANNANRIRVHSGAFFARELILPDGDGIRTRSSSNYGPVVTTSKESNRANANLAPLLLLYELMASGIGWDGLRTFDVIVIGNDDEATAITNAQRLADRVVNSNSGDGLPWAVSLPVVDLSVSGKYMVAVFRDGTSPGSLASGFADGQLLFAHD
jgi:hypothetical protein